MKETIFCKTYNFKEPINRSHPIPIFASSGRCQMLLKEVVVGLSWEVKRERDMNTFTYIYMFTYICIYAYAHTHSHTHIHTHTYKHIHTHIYVCMYVCMYTHTHAIYIYVYTYIYIHVCMYVCMYILFTCTSIHLYAYMLILTCWHPHACSAQTTNQATNCTQKCQMHKTHQHAIILFDDTHQPSIFVIARSTATFHAFLITFHGWALWTSDSIIEPPAWYILFPFSMYGMARICRLPKWSGLFWKRAVYVFIYTYTCMYIYIYIWIRTYIYVGENIYWLRAYFRKFKPNTNAKLQAYFLACEGNDAARESFVSAEWIWAYFVIYNTHSSYRGIFLQGWLWDNTKKGKLLGGLCTCL